MAAANVYEAAYLALREAVRADARYLAMVDAANGGEREDRLSGVWAGDYNLSDIRAHISRWLAENAPEADDDVEFGETEDALASDFESAYSDWFAESAAAGTDA